jgi:hypothetical protein
MKKKLTAILLVGAAAAVPVSAAATSGHPHPGSERAGSKPGVGSGANALFVGGRGGIGGEVRE